MRDVSTASCSHCGEPCSDDTIRADDNVFCCTGCRSVYEILREHDLCDYYAIGETPKTVESATDHAQKFSVIDQPQVLPRFVELSSGTTKRLRFEIPSMHCSSCVWLLGKLHRFDPAILRSEVDFMRKTVRVDIDSDKIQPSAVAQLLSRLGYEPLLSSEGDEVLREQELRKRRRDLYLRLGVAGFAFGNVMMISAAQYLAGEAGISGTLKIIFDVLSVGLALPVLLFSAMPWFSSAYAAIRHRAINLDVPVAMGILVLFCRSIADIALGASEGFLDSFAGLVFFLLIGRLFQQKAFDSVAFNRGIRSFFPLSVQAKHRGEFSTIPIDEVTPGTELLIRNGEVVPSDAVLTSDVGYIDYAFVTGESIPVECVKGALINAGGKVVGTAIELTATKAPSQSYLSSLWERSSQKRERRAFEDSSAKFAKSFTIGTLAIAAIGAIVWAPDWVMAANVFTSVLIIACPCALTIAAPITMSTAMGVLSLRGIFLRSADIVAELNNISDIVFDKTGTLAESVQTVDLVVGGDNLNVQPLVTALARSTIHPVSRALAGLPTTYQARAVEEFVGSGVTGIVHNTCVHLGNAEFIRNNAEGVPNKLPDASAYVAVDNRYRGHVVLQSRLRAGVSNALHKLKNSFSLHLLSGDTDNDKSMFAPFFADNYMKFGASPEDKNEYLRDLANGNRRVLMVGDGLNDAGAMNQATVSIGVADGNSTLVPECDVVMPASSMQHLDNILSYTSNMTKVILFSMIFTVFYNMIGLSLALLGILSPVLTAILMPVSSLIVIGISIGGARWYNREVVWG